MGGCLATPSTRPNPDDDGYETLKGGDGDDDLMKTMAASPPAPPERTSTLPVGLDSSRSGGGYLTFQTIKVKCPITAEWSMRFDFIDGKRRPAFLTMYKSNLYFTKEHVKFSPDTFLKSSPLLRAVAMSIMLCIRRLNLPNTVGLHMLSFLEEYHTLTLDPASEDETNSMFDICVRCGNIQPYPTTTLETIIQNDESNPAIMYQQRHTFSTMATIIRDNDVAMSSATHIESGETAFVDR